MLRNIAAVALWAGAICGGAVFAQSSPSAAQQPAARPILPGVGTLLRRQPAFSDLSPEQKFVLAPFADQWADMPEAKRRQWISLADRFPKLSAEQQTRAQERIQEWAALTAEQRRLARSNYRLARQLGSDARTEHAQQYDTMTDEQKHVLRQAGNTSNTAARHAGAKTALAKEAAKPFPRRDEAFEPPPNAKPQ
jgi:hypothetical protein